MGCSFHSLCDALTSYFSRVPQSCLFQTLMQFQRYAEINALSSSFSPLPALSLFPSHLLSLRFALLLSSSFSSCFRPPQVVPEDDVIDDNDENLALYNAQQQNEQGNNSQVRDLFFVGFCFATECEPTLRVEMISPFSCFDCPVASPLSVWVFLFLFFLYPLSHVRHLCIGRIS